MAWQSRQTKAVVYTDSDFAGCPRTRRSTGGGALMVGGHLLKAYSRTLAVLALSSGEAELMAVVRASMEALGVQALAMDFGDKLAIEVASDATAAIGMVARLGLGRVRHLAVSDLWVQEKSRTGAIKYVKVPGCDNPADIGTKAVTEEVLAAHLQRMGVVALEGRADIAPRRAGNMGHHQI